MTLKYLSLFTGLLAVLLGIVACQQQAEKPTSAESEIVVNISEVDRDLYTLANQLFKPLPKEQAHPKYPLSAAEAKLGKMLFHDTRLSKSNTISCNSCHNLTTFGVDNNPVSVGHGWKTGARNSPTVFNAASHFVQFWDGRASDVEEQAKGPVLNPVEMASPHAEFVVDRLKEIPAYVDLFAAAFPNDPTPLSYDNMARAIGAFERGLMTPGRFDRFLQGDVEALSAEEKQGLRTFVEAGCTSCHLGANLGGNMYQKFGLVKGPYWEYTGGVSRDEGRFEVTGKESDRYVFKVPGLRNINRTYPYFHDGSVWNLDEAVRVMALTQLNKDLSDAQTQSIVAFLNSLEGEIPSDALVLPVLPAASTLKFRPDLN
jgi:cytochrome c peroxidase